MDETIKRLLRLSSIPNFKLMPEEKEILDAWKSAQEPVVIKFAEPKKPVRRKKVKNIVEKETGLFEES